MNVTLNDIYIYVQMKHIYNQVLNISIESSIQEANLCDESFASLFNSSIRFRNGNIQGLFVSLKGPFHNLKLQK